MSRPLSFRSVSRIRCCILRRWRLLQVSRCTHPPLLQALPARLERLVAHLDEVVLRRRGLSKFLDKYALNRFRDLTELCRWSSRVLTNIGETNLPASPSRRQTRNYNMHHQSRFRLAHLDGCIAVRQQSALDSQVPVGGHKIGKMICWVRVNIIGVFVAPSDCRCSCCRILTEFTMSGGGRGCNIRSLAVSHESGG